jgi:hypothetical protein
LCQITLHLEASGQQTIEYALQFKDGRLAAGEFHLKLRGPRLQRTTLLGCALQAYAHGRLSSATTLGPDEQIARRKLRGLRRSAGPGELVARLLTCRIEFGSTRIEIAHAYKTTLEFAPRSSDRLLSHTDLASHLGRLFFQPLAPQRRLLRPGARGLELTKQIGVLPMRLLDASLHGVSRPLGHRQCRAGCLQRRLAVAHTSFGLCEFATQGFEALLAFKHAGMIIATACDANPATTEPLAAARNDRLTRLQRPSQHERFAETCSDAHGGKPLAHRIRSRDLAG